MYERKRMVAGPGFSFISLIFTFSIQSFLSISLVLYDFRKFCGLYLYIFSTDIELPRTLTSDRQGSLPSARVVSNTVLSGSTPTSATHSTFLTHFGQFIDHDVISTPSMRGNLGITNLQVFKFRPFLFPRNPTYVSQMTWCKTAVKFFIVKQFTQYF